MLYDNKNYDCKDDCLCLVILYLYAFKQITTPRYCSYAASLTYIT